MKLFDKLVSLNVHPAICHWTLNLLLHRPQSVKVNNSLSKPVILNTGAPQGCVLSPFLFTLFTNDCVSGNQSVRVVKFSDDTTVIGCVNNESVYREEVQRLVGWCKNNNLVLNISKTKEMIIDFRKKKTPIHPLFIDGAEVLQADSVKFLGSTISKDLSWCNNSIDIIKKTQKRMYFLSLRHLKRFGLSQAILTRFYHAVIESVLSFSITV